ncbi:MAG: hypothetical protein N4A35_10130 [Flavobacteriales bacterium]|jgi:hypothetical protein|nr:hypothetical protein [Flavobacteriales bacterium]
MNKKFLILTLLSFGCSTDKKGGILGDVVISQGAPYVEISLSSPKYLMKSQLDSVISSFENKSSVYFVNYVFEEDSLGGLIVDYQLSYPGEEKPKFSHFFISNENVLLVDREVLKENNYLNSSYNFFMKNFHNNNRDFLYLDWNVDIDDYVVQSKIEEIKLGYLKALDSINSNTEEKNINQLMVSYPFMFSIRQTLINRFLKMKGDIPDSLLPPQYR